MIGGSLAGSAAACALARTGTRVIVLEKARFPRDKVCGCFLSDEAFGVLARMGFGDELGKNGAETITHFRLVRRDGTAVESRLPRSVMSVSRSCLDSLAADAAERAGAEMRFGATVLAIEGDLSRGFLVRGVDWELRARAVVGAWGRYSPLDGRLGRAFVRRGTFLFGFGKRLAGHGERFANRAVLHSLEGGYLGLSRVEGGGINLAGLVTAAVAKRAHASLEELLSEAASASRALAADLEGLTPVTGPPLVSEPVVLGRHGALAGDVLCVGDAAGVIDPYTGTGMSLALRFGEAAAAPLAGFIAKTLDAQELRRAHLRLHREIAGRRFLLSRLFRPFFAGGFASRLVSPAAAPIARWAARVTRG